MASSYPVTSQTLTPNGMFTLLTGAVARISPSSATGSSPVRFSGSSAASGSSAIFDRSNPLRCARVRYQRVANPTRRSFSPMSQPPIATPRDYPSGAAGAADPAR